MRQIQFERFGGPDVLQLIECPTPAPGPGQVLIRVHAIGLNFFDTLMRQNKYAITPVLPAVLGVEIAGTIERLGAGVSDLVQGARVAVPLFATGATGGGYSDYAVVDAGLVVSFPAALSFEAATALMVQGLTALQLVTQIPPAGKTVLINAAAGGVGSLLIQLARRAGAKTLIGGASSAAKLELARDLGCDVVLDYTRPGWIEQAVQATRGYGPDIIYESSGGQVTKDSLAGLAPGGELVIYGALNIQEFQLGVSELMQLMFKNQSLTGFVTSALLTPQTLRSGLGALFDLAARGELRVTIGGTYALEHAADAHGALEGRKTMGKVVLVP
jgi:NADPH2:quinone reductase